MNTLKISSKRIFSYFQTIIFALVNFPSEKKMGGLRIFEFSRFKIKLRSEKDVLLWRGEGQAKNLLDFLKKICFFVEWSNVLVLFSTKVK